jgi:O-antigen/teichoic acid export membrane protein
VAAAIAAAALAGWLVPFVFGTAYRGSIEPLRWLLPGTLAFSLQSVLSNYIAGRGRPRLVLIAWLAGAVVAIAADLVVIPAFGIAGAAIVSSASYVLVTSIHFRALRSVTTGA